MAIILSDQAGDSQQKQTAQISVKSKQTHKMSVDKIYLTYSVSDIWKTYIFVGHDGKTNIFPVEFDKC